MAALGWITLLAGLALWSAAHLMRRLAPEMRARYGDATDPKDRSKGAFALAILASVVLLYFGYRWAPFVPIWTPPPWTTHLNNLLVLLAFYIFFAGAMRVRLAQKIRHPQLIGFKTWAVAHLLVNGHLAAILLFGGLLAWGVVEVIAINRAEGRDWTRPEWGGPVREAGLVGLALAVYVVVALLHWWAGVYPFPG
jgi:uncharacterized membrane protein